MLIFNCSKSAAEFFTCIRNNMKSSPLEIAENKKIEEDSKTIFLPDGGASAPYHWQVHAVKVNRKNCLVAMDIQTRYSITIANLKKGDAEGFVKSFIDRLVTNMLRQGKELRVMDEHDFEPMLKEFTEQHSGFRFYQRSDRSVQAHINDVVWHFRNQVESSGFPKSETEAARFDRFANELLRKTKLSDDYFTPSDEMTISWLSRYFGVTEETILAVRKTMKELAISKFDDLFDNSQRALKSDTTSHKNKSTENTTFPDNVVSLAAYRKQKF